MATSPTVRLKLLTMELRRLRDQSGKTIEEAADGAGISKSALSRIENGLVGIRTPVLRALLQEYDVPVERQAGLHALAGESRRRGWWQTEGAELPDDLPSPEWRTLVGLEAEAAAINAYSGTVVNGLLQTREYAYNLVRGNARNTLTTEQVEMVVELRLRRQERLAELDLWAILTEEVLLRPVGGEAVMRAQIEHLIASAGRKRIVVQILPLSAGEHVGLRGPFTVLDFEPPVVLQAVYLEGNRVEACLEGVAQVEPYRRDFEHLRAKALDPDASAKFMTRILGRNSS